MPRGRRGAAFRDRASGSSRHRDHACRVEGADCEDHRLPRRNPRSAFDGAEARTITLRSGQRELSFPATEYLYGFAIPNIDFHMTTAYAIRANGVEIGKTDFLGA